MNALLEDFRGNPFVCVCVPLFVCALPRTNAFLCVSEEPEDRTLATIFSRDCFLVVCAHGTMFYSSSLSLTLRGYHLSYAAAQFGFCRPHHPEHISAHRAARRTVHFWLKALYEP